MTHPWKRRLERVRLVAPLGVRFWDAVMGAVVADGLEVGVFPKGRPERRVAATVNRSGVFAARGLPGLAAFETGGEPNPAARPFVIEVTDRAGRFLPFALPADLPAGLLEWEPNEPMVPLYSAPGRPVPAGMAVARAQLVRADVPPDPLDPQRRLPAAWAVVEVTLPDGAAFRGLADENGGVAVVFPYPEPPDPPVVPSPPPGPVAPTDRTWVVGVKAFFAPPAPAATTPEHPDLRAALAQPAARLWADTDRTTELTAATVRFGAELVLRTTVTGTNPPESVPELFITAP